MASDSHKRGENPTRNRSITVEVPVWLDDDAIVRLISHAVTHYVSELRESLPDDAVLVTDTAQA